MKLMSSLHSAFMKASHYPVFQTVVDHAAKITSAGFVASDAVLLSFNYLKNGTLFIDPTDMNADELISVGGFSYIIASLVYGAADNHPAAKKITAGLSLLGVGAVTAASVLNRDAALFGSAAPIAFTSLSLMFEKQANAASEKVAAIKGWAGKTAKFYLSYPVATAAGVQTIGVASALAAGLNDPGQRLLIVYAGVGFLSNAAFALTDDNVKRALKTGVEPVSEI